MKKVIILQKIQVTMRTFVLPFFNHFSLSMNRKQRVRARRKKKKHIYASAANLSYIRKGNLNCCMGGHCKNEATEIDCLCCREIEVDAMLIILTKIPQCEESISLPAFMSYCRTISRTCQPYLPGRRVLLFVPGVARRNEVARGICEYKLLSFCFWC